MRSDLSAAFIAAKNSSFRRPRQLLVFHFASGPVYLSDQKIVLGGNEYLPLVEEWGGLDTAGDSETDTGEIRQMTIVLWNGGKSPFSDRFFLEHPENVEVELYQWFVGLDDSDKALIDRFVVQDPISFAEADRLVNLDFVSLGMRYDGPVGDLLTRDNFPFALDSDVNKGIPLIVGNPGQVKTLCGRTAPAATMTGSILLLPTIVNVFEDLNDIGFPASGKIQIDTEIMVFSSRDNDTFTITIRGADGTKAAEHSDGATVIQHITDHTYIVGQPLAAINDVLVGGMPAKAGTYAVNPATDPATIIFNTKPSFTSYSKGARNTLLDFDAETTNNRAFQPHYAYSEDEKSNGALLSRDYTPLALIQHDPVPDDGEVVRAFLSVEHWATDQYLQDLVEVWVSGIGVVGTLAKPNAADVAAFSAEVNLDHGHAHKTGGAHAHHSTDPGFASSAPSHRHPLDNSESGTTGSIDTSTQTSYRSTGYNYPYAPNLAGQTRTLVGFRITGGSVYSTGTRIYYPSISVGGVTVNIRDHRNVIKYAWISSATHIPIDVRVVGSSGSTKWVSWQFVSIKVYSASSNTDLTNLSIATSKSSSGFVSGLNVATTNIKDATDVTSFAEANRQLENIVTQSSSRSIVQKFDLTKLLKTISWDWFLDREIQIRYIGSANTAKIIVTYVNFEVEYRQRETVLTDDVSCAPTGLIDNRPDMVIDYLLTLKAGLPAINGSFISAGTRFAELGYQLDGVLSADNTVRSAIKKICQQTRSRLIWDGGVAKLVIREKTDKWQSVKNLTPGNLKQKAIRVHRQPVSEIVNDINLFYNKDHSLESDTQSAYLTTAKKSDLESIDKHGIKRDDSRFAFDLVTDLDMAESLADFYIWLLGEPSSFYEFTGYLPQIDLEKEDVIRVTSQGFSRIVKLPMIIRGVDRYFGSAKTKTINHCRIIAESIRLRFIELMHEDTLGVVDDLSYMLERETISAYPILLSDLLTSQLIRTREDSVSFVDQLTQTFEMVKETEEVLLFSEAFSTEFIFTTEDEVIITDFEGDYVEQTGVSDELIIDSGFGSPLGDGFGMVPFGSPKE